MRYPMLGEPPAMMAVPTHFFKVILVEGKDDTRIMCGVRSSERADTKQLTFATFRRSFD